MIDIVKIKEAVNKREIQFILMPDNELFVEDVSSGEKVKIHLDRVKGQWKKYETRFKSPYSMKTEVHEITECSICHRKMADYCGLRMRYCPHCGSRMSDASE